MSSNACTRRFCQNVTERLIEYMSVKTSISIKPALQNLTRQLNPFRDKELQLDSYYGY